MGGMQVPPVRRQSAFDTAPPEHSLALSAFRRRTSGAASQSDAVRSSVLEHTEHARSEPSSVQRLPSSVQAEARHPPNGNALTLGEVSAAVAAAKLSLPAPASDRAKPHGASSLIPTLEVTIVAVLSSSLLCPPSKVPACVL